jgi:hypothetical protein
MELLRRIAKGDEAIGPPRIGKCLHGPTCISPALRRADTGKHLRAGQHQDRVFRSVQLAIFAACPHEWCQQSLVASRELRRQRREYQNRAGILLGDPTHPLVTIQQSGGLYSVRRDAERATNKAPGLLRDFSRRCMHFGAVLFHFHLGRPISPTG